MDRTPLAELRARQATLYARFDEMKQFDRLHEEIEALEGEKSNIEAKLSALRAKLGVANAQNPAREEQILQEMLDVRKKITRTQQIGAHEANPVNTATSTPMTGEQPYVHPSGVVKLRVNQNTDQHHHGQTDDVQVEALPKPKPFGILHDEFGCIIYDETCNGCIEIRCHREGCRANANREGDFFRGLAGLTIHVNTHYKDQTWTKSMVLESCTVRRLTDAQVREIKKWDKKRPLLIKMIQAKSDKKKRAERHEDGDDDASSSDIPMAEQRNSPGATGHQPTSSSNGGLLPFRASSSMRARKSALTWGTPLSKRTADEAGLDDEGDEEFVP